MPASQTERDWIYNGLDSMVDFEIFAVLENQFDNVSRATYEFSKDLLGPILEMNMRGVLVDEDERQRSLRSYGGDLVRLEKQLSRITRDGVGLPTFNWRSNADLIQLFYKKLGLPPVRKRNANGEAVPTVNREALEKLDDYLYAKPIVAHLLALRDIGKKIGFLRTSIDKDGRIRTSYNIGGTTTGRLSSSFSEFGTGTNLQNIEQRLRRIFVADPGYKFCNIDLEQSDSRALGAIEWDTFGDSRYLDACESGDLHTQVSRLCWPQLSWSGEAGHDRRLAEQPFYRQHSRRHMAKVLGHGTNFLGQPPEMHRHTHIPVKVIKDFQAGYFAAFPCHLRWHSYVAQTLIDRGSITSLLGRRRTFFGRRRDPATIREAVAFEPQSITADTIDRGLLAVWKSRQVELLLQVHDSILVQYPESSEDDIVPMLRNLVEQSSSITLRGDRKFTIPAEAKVGWNWSDANEENPDGLKKYIGHDSRRRCPRASETTIVDRGVFRVNERYPIVGKIPAMVSDNSNWSSSRTESLD
jgi:DNA polymerase-1